MGIYNLEIDDKTELGKSLINLLKSMDDIVTIIKTPKDEIEEAEAEQ